MLYTHGVRYETTYGTQLIFIKAVNEKHAEEVFKRKHKGKKFHSAFDASPDTNLILDEQYSIK